MSRPANHRQLDNGSPFKPSWADSPKQDFVNKSGFQKGKLVRSSRNTKRPEAS